MKIALGADHGGYLLKNDIANCLKNEGFEIFDEGTNSSDSVDYPIFAKKVAEKVAKKEVDFGILVCTTGEGIMMAANKVRGVRAGIGYNDNVAEMMRRHNNANVIAFGAKFTTSDEAIKRVKIFLETPFEGGRHERRVNQIEN